MNKVACDVLCTLRMIMRVRDCFRESGWYRGDFASSLLIGDGAFLYHRKGFATVKCESL